MKYNKPNIETIIIFLMSSGLIMISLPKICLKLLCFVYPLDLSEKRVNIMSYVLLTYGIVMLVFATLSYIFSLKKVTLLSQFKRYINVIVSTLQKEVSLSIQYFLSSGYQKNWLILALLIGCATRGYFLAQPMRYDEAFTFLSFVNKDFYHLFFYTHPNNQVLHTLLVKASTFVWGGGAATIRFPSFLAGVGLIPLTFLLCRKLKVSGIFASIAISVFPYLIAYSTNARGYSLLVFLTVFLTLTGIQTLKVPSVVGTTIFSVIASLGMLTMPSMLFPIAGIYCWLVCLFFINGESVRNISYKFAIPCVLLTFIFTAILYTPVILASNGIESIVGNQFVQSQPWDGFLRSISPHFQKTYNVFYRDIPKPVLFTCLMLVIIGTYASIRKQNWNMLFLLPSVCFGSAIVFFIKHRIPYPRTWIYIIPFILLLADSGFTYITENVSRKIRLFINLSTLIIGTFVAASLISKNVITSYPETGNFQEAQIVAKYLKPIMTPNDKIHVQCPADIPTLYYLWFYNIPEQNVENNSGQNKEFFIVKKSEYSIKEMTDKRVIKLLDLDDMTIYQTVVVEDQ
jgi:hypothetical protein